MDKLHPISTSISEKILFLSEFTDNFFKMKAAGYHDNTVLYEAISTNEIILADFQSYLVKGNERQTALNLAEESVYLIGEKIKSTYTHLIFSHNILRNQSDKQLPEDTASCDMPCEKNKRWSCLMAVTLTRLFYTFPSIQKKLLFPLDKYDDSFWHSHVEQYLENEDTLNQIKSLCGSSYNEIYNILVSRPDISEQNGEIISLLHRIAKKFYLVYYLELKLYLLGLIHNAKCFDTPFETYPEGEGHLQQELIKEAVFEGFFNDANDDTGQFMDYFNHCAALFTIDGGYFHRRKDESFISRTEDSEKIENFYSTYIASSVPDNIKRLFDSELKLICKVYRPEKPAGFLTSLKISKPREKKKAEYVFSYTWGDFWFVRELKEILEGNRYTISREYDFVEGNLSEKLDPRSNKYAGKVIVFLLSNNYLLTLLNQHEIRKIIGNELKKEKEDGTIAVFLLENCHVPYLFADKIIANFSRILPPSKKTETERPREKISEPEIGCSCFYERLKRKVREDVTPFLKRVADNKEWNTGGGYDDVPLEIELNNLKEAGDHKKLTFFLGSGMSSSAGLPQWSKLLADLVVDEGVFGKTVNAGELVNFYKQNQLSYLILAQYLKNFLDKDFLSRVKEILYKEKLNLSAKKLSGLMAVAALCKECRKVIASVITLNFDDILEHCLSEADCNYKPIFGPDQEYSPFQLPVFHVHGYLPNNQYDVPGNNNFVFSEDSYHSQFTDQYNWANITQLSALENNICIFMGLSLSDPNLRRLLDVARRSQKDRKPIHYIVYKRRKEEDIKKYSSVDESDPVSFVKEAEVVNMLFEEDAFNLGLNVIWINDYNEIEGILLELKRKLNIKNTEPTSGQHIKKQADL